LGQTFAQNTNFEWVIEPKYNSVENFREGFAKVELNGKYGFIDKTGKIVLEAKYDKIGSFREGLAKVKLNGKYGLLTKQENLSLNHNLKMLIYFLRVCVQLN